MPSPHRLSAFILLALLVIGCGKKADPDATPASGSNSTPGGQTTGIEGTYLVVSFEMWGKKSSAEEIAKDSELDRTVKISKDQIQLKLFKRDTVGYKLDPSKSPAEIDITTDKPGKKPEGNDGIYKVEGDTLTFFIAGAKEPQFRPREFKTLNLFKDGKLDKAADKQQVGGFLMLTLKKLSNDTTFISEPPPKPKPPEIDQDGPVVAELTKKGFKAEKMPYGKFPGVDVTVPSTLPLDVMKELNGHPRIRSITFKPTQLGNWSHPVTDEAVQALNKLDGLTSLEFQSCPKITGAAFRDLSRFPLLTHVQVSSSPIDDSATEELAKVKKLEWVHLDGAKLTDKSLANLTKIKTLKSLWLESANVTASGIKLINSLPDLEFLALQGMPVADKALGELNLPKLEFLNLAKSDISDEGLGKLPVLPKLRNLTLSGVKLTDAGLKHLQKQPSLDDVTLFETKATEAGAAELRKLKPKLLIAVIK